MLSNLVGPVDVNAAIVLAVAFVCLCVVVTSLIIKRRSRLDVSNEFFLKKKAQEEQDKRSQYALETERAYKFKQLDKNLITSHRTDDKG